MQKRLWFSWSIRLARFDLFEITKNRANSHLNLLALSYIFFSLSKLF